MISLAIALTLTVLNVPIATLAQEGSAETIRTGAALVTADRLNVRLAPSPSGKITNVLDRGQKVNVLEVRGEWARISRYYDGSIEGVSGGVARWVSIRYLSHSEYFKMALSNSLEIALSNSDDFRKYRSTFLGAAKQLVSQRRCTVKDFEEWGGWIRSATHGWPLYFTFCGGAHISNRIYLNVRSGRTSR